MSLYEVIGYHVTLSPYMGVIGYHVTLPEGHIRVTW